MPPPTVSVQTRMPELPPIELQSLDDIGVYFGIPRHGALDGPYAARIAQSTGLSPMDIIGLGGRRGRTMVLNRPGADPRQWYLVDTGRPVQPGDMMGLNDDGTVSPVGQTAGTYSSTSFAGYVANSDPARQLQQAMDYIRSTELSPPVRPQPPPWYIRDSDPVGRFLTTVEYERYMAARDTPSPDAIVYGPERPPGPTAWELIMDEDE